MQISIHRREQWDLTNDGSVKPFVACHVKKGNIIKRLFVLWSNGFRGFGVFVKWGKY